MLPIAFQRQMQALLGTEYAAFEAALQEAPPVSIRWNRAKASLPGALSGGEGARDLPGANPSSPPERAPESEAVPWHPDGVYLAERPVFTLDPLLHAGAYYVQEASSMFLYQALRQTVDFSKSLKVLDLCAAPGGKSSLIAAMLGPGSLLVANEVVPQRVPILRENLARWGAPNVAVASAEASVFTSLAGWFDVVVVDAPCSGEGLFRKDPDAVSEWSPAQVEVCAGRQRDILAHAVEALGPGGTLVYSTCTYNRAENEAQIDRLLSQFDLTPERLDVPAGWGILEAGNGYRFFPQRLRGEGFFLSVLKKKPGLASKPAAPPVFKSLKPLSKNLLPEMANWLAEPGAFRFFQTPGGEALALPAVLESAFLILDKILKNKWFGVDVGEFKGQDFVPAHALALSTARSPTLPRVALSREQALLFLKKETFALPAGTPRGWALAAFEGLALGWMKVLPNRMNNYLPAERRIRMELDR